MSETARTAPAAASLAALSHDLMAGLEPDGRIAWANEAWRRLLGWDPDELSGRPLAERLEGELAPGGDTVLEIATRSGGRRPMAVSSITAGGVTYICARDA